MVLFGLLSLKTNVEVKHHTHRPVEASRFGEGEDPKPGQVLGPGKGTPTPPLSGKTGRASPSQQSQPGCFRGQKRNQKGWGLPGQGHKFETEKKPGPEKNPKTKIKQTQGSPPPRGPRGKPGQPKENPPQALRISPMGVPSPNAILRQGALTSPSSGRHYPGEVFPLPPGVYFSRCHVPWKRGPDDPGESNNSLLRNSRAPHCGGRC
ncbi:proline-rich protein 2-like [Penaeus monodon]|uniref:proline-rich protein 2-like n=1 Tax=Penaeus monodon TaxID=6687 RepID=UPI0018A76E26|nr:proline-rich protein 2-like [Penaeus monodon]